MGKRNRQSLVVIGTFATLAAGSALATDKPAIGPVPSWVRPISSPPPSPPTGAKSDETPTRILLADQQVLLEPGKQTNYFDTMLRIQTPQGLSAGNISIPWRPDTDTLTVHTLRILRGDQTIDVLASGQTFTVLRREQNLESAMLDGVLTANIQPEGLQVGDVIQIAASISSSDPILEGHVEQVGGAWNDYPVTRAHLRIQWPTTLPMHYRQTALLPAARPVREDGLSGVDLSVDNVEPVVAPKFAPARFRVGRLAEATDYASWADLGTLMAPLYIKAATIAPQGPLHAELDRINGLSSDPKTRAEAALVLVQDRVRYVALTMGAGGYVPADAEQTWSRRFGDCKGKTALLLALLHGSGIAAEPVAVSTVFGDGLDARLPMIGLFNHVLVRASISGRTYWLDGTRSGDTSLERLIVPRFGWGLPLVTQGAALVRIMPPPLEVPLEDVSIHIDASGGISAPAPTTVESILRGDQAIATNIALASFAGDARDRALKDYWKEQYDFIDPKTATASFDAKTGEERLLMTGDAKLDWANGNYQTDGTNVGYKADFTRVPGRGSDAPYAVTYPTFARTRETIVLPKGYGTFSLGSDMQVDRTAGGIEYKRHAAITGNVFSIERTERSVVPEFPAKDAAGEQAALRTLADAPASIRMPAGYSYTGKDIEAVRTQEPTTASGYLTRADVFVHRGQNKDALLDFDKAIALDPANGATWAARSAIRATSGDLAGAKADLAHAMSISPGLPANFVAQGMIAEAERRWRDAIAAYSAYLAREPADAFSLIHRASAYARVDEIDLSMADLTKLVATQHGEGAFAAYMTRGNVYLDRQRYDEAIADFDHAVTLDPSSAMALANRGIAHVWKHEDAAAERDLAAAAKIDAASPVLLRARALSAELSGRLEAAITGYTAAIKAEPANNFALYRRALTNHAAGHDDAALEDAAAALKLEPARSDLYLLRANIFKARGREAEGIAEAERLSASNPTQTYAQVAAANIYSSFRRNDEALRAFDRAIAIKPEGYIYLNRALRRPPTDKAGRRTDVDAALRLDPDLAEAVAEKARLQADEGDLSGAVATYSAALAKSPDSLELLTGRGMAYERIGDGARADADFTRARTAAHEPMLLNNICWIKATAGFGLAAALADCDAALAATPPASASRAGYLDSRALVLLRLGRLDEAIADYNQALAQHSGFATSLFGRAVAWSRKGERAKSAVDAAAAAKIEPEVRLRFEQYGVKM